MLGVLVLACNNLQLESASRHDQSTCRVFVPCTCTAMKLRLIEQACGCSARCVVEADSRCVLGVLGLALRWRVLGATKFNRAPSCRLFVPCTRAAKELRLIEQAQAVVLHGAWWRRTQCACQCSAWRGHSGGECLPPRTERMQVLVPCTDAAIKLRLVEQVCGCSAGCLCLAPEPLKISDRSSKFAAVLQVVCALHRSR